MAIRYEVPLSKIIQIKDLNLEVVYLPQDASQIKITTSDINRPGLHLAGYFEYFHGDRIQVMGKSEVAYLHNLAPEEQRRSMERFFAAKPAIVIYTRMMQPDALALELAKLHGVALLITSEPTSEFDGLLNNYLSTELAPRVTRHGVLVEVYGEGVLLLGDSGVGKSETAIELVKRGHRLIADDAVEIRKIGNRTLIGSSPENIRHFMEMRGIGIINVKNLFGIGAVKISENIDMVISLEHWDKSKVYDRMGIDDQTMNILGIEIPLITVPVKPGRNLAIIIEVAAMNHRQKKMGYNAAQDLLRRLGMMDDLPEDAVQNEKYVF